MMKEEFLEYLSLERNYSQSTVDNYGRALRSLKDYFETLEEPLSWLTIDSDIVRGWIGQLMMRVRALPLSILSSVRLEPSTAGHCDVDW